MYIYTSIQPSLLTLSWDTSIEVFASISEECSICITNGSKHFYAGILCQVSKEDWIEVIYIYIYIYIYLNIYIYIYIYIYLN